MGKSRRRYLFVVAGIVSMIAGLMLSVPSFLERVYWLASVSFGLIVLGLILLAFAFGD